MIMADQSDETTLVQEREELMVSLSGTPILRLAHFLTPSHNSIDGSYFHLPQKPLSTSDLDTKEYHIRFNFCRWKYSSPEWEKWVDIMYSKHQTVWEKTGILYALLNSKYTIYKDDELLYVFAARWCSETNTFVFPWGEATVTLEDMMVLGGYSVLGDSVFSPLETQKMKEIERKLEQERLDLVKSKAKKASHSSWLDKFIDSGNEIEHEAFLVYWLSRFVFPLAEGSIVKSVFPIAVHLAKGTKIALAPAVLATIYSDLNAYKKSVFMCGKPGQNVLVSSPFNLILIWVWERFPLLQPKPKNVKTEEPFFAKWHESRRNNGGIVKKVTDKAVESFIWRPYTKFDCTDEEKEEAMARCLRVCQIIGIETNKCIEQYLPHRVAMQFGLDQDIPSVIEQAMLVRKAYNRPIIDKIFRIPSNLYEPNVTVRYLKWWKKPLLSTQDVDCDALASKKPKVMDSATNFNTEKETASRDEELLDSCKNFDIKGSENNLKRNPRVFGDGMSYKRVLKRMALKSCAMKLDVDIMVPPGFPSKCNKAIARSSYAKDVENADISKAFVEKISNHDKQKEVKSIPCLTVDSLLELDAKISNIETILARYKSD